MTPTALRHHLTAVALIAIGGALGSSLRYLLGATAGVGLFETAAVNALGSFGLGLLLFDARADAHLSPRARYVFGVGFFASFTSYSTFVADIAIVGSGVSVAYIIASYSAALGGVVISRMIVDLTSTDGVAADSGWDE